MNCVGVARRGPVYAARTLARRHDKLFIAPTTKHAALAVDGEPALYLEYVDELRKVPTLPLHDEVIVSPRPKLPVDFRQGQRPNARKEARDDPYRLREEQASDHEALYLEYASGAGGPKKKSKRSRAQGDSAARAPTRKRRQSGRKRRKS